MEELKAEGRTMPSCLRNGNSSVNKHRVSFPNDDSDLVTAYLEPASPWDSTPVTPDDLIALYEDSCVKHKTEPLQQVIEQLKTCHEPQPTLEITGEITWATLESLETILQRVRFHTIRISSSELYDDAAVALFDMLEYYESAGTLSLTCEAGLGMRSWQACSRMLKKTHGLTELDIRGTPVNDQVMPVLCRSLKIGSKSLTSLQLPRCGTSGRALAILGNSLRLNSSLQELTLSDNDLVASDTLPLAQMLRINVNLRYLDVSNNGLGDAGCANLCDALAEHRGIGLQALVMWNTALTAQSAVHFAQVLTSLSPLDTINIGQNQIGDTGLSVLRDAMKNNNKVKLLGLQAAQISCDGAENLAQIMRSCKSLQRVDARSNNIGIRGLTALNEAVKSGTSLQRLDLDDVPGPYQVIIDDIRDCFRLNEARLLAMEEEETARITNFSRKISLTCETLMMRPMENRGLLAEPRKSSRLRSPAPSPIPSPSSSPVPSPSRNRFRVSRVSEDSPPISPISPVSSRFRVTVVEPEVASVAAPPPLAVPEPVVSAGSKVQVGFEPPAAVSPVAARKVSVTKPQSSMEKLLGLFQNPSSLFTSVANVTMAGDKEKNTQSQDSNWDWD